MLKSSSVCGDLGSSGMGTFLLCISTIISLSASIVTVTSSAKIYPSETSSAISLTIYLPSLNPSITISPFASVFGFYINGF